MIKKTEITITKAIILFEYKNVNKRYQNRSKFYQQAINKALSIVKAFYQGYSLLFLLNNTINYLIYA